MVKDVRLLCVLDKVVNAKMRMLECSLSMAP